jgi:8-oxo-dGTP diphosphatase
MQLRGVITWTDFGPKREDWLGFIFLVRDWDGNPKAFNDEGSLEWVPKQNLLNACSSDSLTRKEMNLPLWEGDRYFIPLVFDNDPRTFYGLMPYDGKSFESWSYERL